MTNLTDSTIRILHVDDDSSLLRISKLMLKTLNTGFVIDGASGVDEAFRKLSENKYDVIVSDFDMPIKNGLDFLKELRIKKNETPFILFTGKGREEIAIQALNLGADGYYNKQGNPETVYGELVHGILAITEKRKIQTALKESEKRYQSLLLNASEMISIHDSKGNFLFANLKCCTNLGYTPEELCKMSIADIDDKALDGEANKLWLKVLAGETFTFESMHKRKDGSKYPVEVTVSAINYANQTCILGFARNITERKVIETTLRQSNLIFEHSLDLFCVAGYDGYYKVLNPAWSKTLGWSNQELMAKPWIEFVHPDDRASTEEAKSILISGKSLAEFRNRYFCKDGQLIWLSWDATSYPNEKIFYAVARDVTERKKTEEILERNKKELSIIIDSSPSIIFFKDINGRIVQTNKAFANSINSTVENLIGKTVFDIFPFEIAKAMTNDDEKVFKTKQPKLNIVEPYQAPTGLGWIKTSKIPILDEKGEVTGLIGFSEEITEKKKVGDALKRSDAEYTSLFNNMIDGFAYCQMIFDENNKPLDFIYLQINDAFETITGLKREQVVGKRVTLAIPGIKESNPELFDIYGRVALTSKTERFEVFFKPLNMWIKVSVYSPKKGYFAAIFENITECKNNEELLRRSQLFLENSSDSIIVTNLDGTITSWNKGAENIFGYTTEEMIGQSILKVVKPQEKAEIAYQQLDNVRKGKMFAQAWEGVRKDGSPVWLMLNTKRMENENGEPIAMVGFAKDITEYKKAEESLLESEERYRLLYQSAGIGVGYYTVRGEVISYNEIALQHMGGLKLSDVVGKSVFDLFPKENAEIYLNRIKTTNELGKSLEFTDEVPLPVGKIWFLSVFSSVKNAEGKTIGIQIMSVDITKQKLAEQKLEDSHKRIEEINEKLHVVGGLTRHDVGNKLLIAKTSLYLLKQKSKQYPELKDFIVSIDDAIKESTIIFELSKQYEKIGSEKLTQISIKEEFDKAAKLTPHKNIDIECNIGDLTVLADSMLQQLFYNLITNSIKHGKITSKITLNAKKTATQATLIYQDNGTGIIKENKNKIFTEGFTTGGSGLGLKLVKKMIDVYGWTINEEGEEGKGAKFVITIPIDKSDDSKEVRAPMVTDNYDS